MNEKTFWLEANKRAIKARFRMFVEDVHKDPGRFLKEEVPDHINLLRAIREYREMLPEERRNLREAFEKFLDATIQALKILSEEFAHFRFLGFYQQEGDKISVKIPSSLPLHYGTAEGMWARAEAYRAYCTWEQAHQLLRQLGAPTYDRLLEELNHSNAFVRQAVVLAFGGPDGQEEVWRFLDAVGYKLLTDPDPIVRRNAARTLELTGHPAATAYFVYALKHDTSARVRAWGARGLEATGTLEHMLVLGQAARSDYTEMELTEEEGGGRTGPTVAEAAARALIAIAEREKFPYEEEQTPRGTRRAWHSLPPSEGLVEALAWGDEKGNIYECRIVQALREESKFYAVELKYWDLPNGQDRLVECSQLLPESEISQLQPIWHQYCIKYGCPDELRLKLKGPEPTIRLSSPLSIPAAVERQKEPAMRLVKPLALGPKGEYLGCVGCEEKDKDKFQIWSACPPQYLWQLECDFPVDQITFSANGQIVAIARDWGKNIVVCLGYILGHPFPHLKKIECPYVRRITLSPDGQYLAVHRLLGQHRLEIWEPWEKSDCPKLEFPYREVFSSATRSFFNPPVAFSPDSRLITVLNFYPGFAGFEIWDLHSANKVKVLGQEGLAPMEARFSRDGKKLMAIVEGIYPELLPVTQRTKLILDLSESGTISRLLAVWDIESGQMDGGIFHLNEALEDVKDFLFSPYGECIAGVRESDKMIQLFIPAQGLTLTLGNTPQNQLIGFSSDGLALASVSLDDEIHIWELSSLLGSP